MSANGIVKGAQKRLTWLGAIAAILAGIIGLGVLFQAAGASFVPQLALDLQGGTQIILTPQLANGKTVTADQLNQAVAIIRQRVDSTGVSEASITTQGNSNVIVSIPGKPDDNTLKLIEASAKLQFRPVLATSASSTASVGTSTETTRTAAATPTGSPLATSSAAPTNGSDLNWVSPALQAQYENLDCSKQFRAPGQVDDDSKPVVTCDTALGTKFILGPVEIQGSDIANANAGTVNTSTGASTGNWAINLSFNGKGTSEFANVTKRLYPLSSPRNQFAVTLDGYVITAPQTNAVITNGEAQITGSFTAQTSKSLADQLKYGSLPIGFNVLSKEDISATLGSQQLSSGLLAGAIGLLIVVLYSFLQYRGLAVVTVGSLVVAALLTYIMVSLLSWRQGYRLSLAGVTGLIVSIGITADSFIIYFERVRDELRDGRSLSAAVDGGWKRAIRTILVSDGISFLAATVLYLLTVGNVRGFAYTLGLTTIIDVLVVVLFTHPMLQILATREFFSSGSKWSGFDVNTMKDIAYVGRGQFRVSENLGAGKAAKASKEATKRQTIAERKSAENKGEAN
ncbi:MAG: protein translocase subunit SecD [Actinomycetales bacterium]|nr:protein translocase subunit SecD [Actinomycetales bacterium]